MRILPTTYHVGGRVFVSATDAAAAAAQARAPGVAVRACGDAPFNMVGNAVSALQAVPVADISMETGYGPSFCAAP